MAETSFLYGNVFIKVFDKTIDFDSDTFKEMLCTSTYTPNQDTHVFKSDVTNEVTGTAYVAGGATLVTPVFTYTAGTNVIKWDANDVQWATSTITARYAVIYDSTPATDATRPLVAYVDFGVDKVSSGGNFDIAWNASGIFTVTVA